MKILHLTTSLSGGAGIAAARLHRAMVQEELDSKLLALRGTPKSLRETTLSWGKKKVIAPLKEWWGWRQHRRQLNRSQGLFSLGQNGFSIQNHPWVQEADLLYLHWVVGGFLSLQSLEKLFLLDKKIVWVMHDQWPMSGGCHHTLHCNGYRESCNNCPALLGKLQCQEAAHQQWLAKKSFLGGQNWSAVAPSQWLAKVAQQSSLLGRGRVVQIPNLLDDTLFYPRSKREMRTKLQLDLDVRWALIFANSNFYKGWSLFLEALKFLEPNDSWGVLICGDRESANQLPLGWKSRFYPTISNQEQLAELYSAADFFVAPSLADNYPNVAIESLACGTAVVATAVGGLVEIVEQWGGLLAEPQNGQSLADQLRKGWSGEIAAAESKEVRNAHQPKQVIERHRALWNSFNGL